MAGNHLEDLVAEWYQFRGFFVRRNVQVGKLAHGGHECELDIVAFDAQSRRLIHIEPSLDTHSWEQRERRYAKKFVAGRRHIASLFPGVKVPEPEQIALFVYGSRKSRTTLAGGRILLIRDFMLEVLESVREHQLASSAIPEQYPLLRTLQFAAQFWPLMKGGAI